MDGGNLVLAKLKDNPKLKACFQDVWKVSTLLAAAGVELDTPNSEGSTETTRYSGTVVDIVTTYSNIKEWRIGATARVNYFYNATQQKGSEYKAVDRAYDPDGGNSATGDYHGIYFRYIASGYIGDGDFLSFLITMTVSLSLFGTATVLIDLLSIYVLPEKKMYRAASYEESLDFSDLKKRLKAGESQESIIDDLRNEVRIEARTHAASHHKAGGSRVVDLPSRVQSRSLSVHGGQNLALPTMGNGGSRRGSLFEKNRPPKL